MTTLAARPATITASLALSRDTRRPTVRYVPSRREYVDRTTQREDVLYVTDGTPWFTPDGEGRIYLFADDEQTVPMTVEQAKDETGLTRVVQVDHACDWNVCDRADGSSYCAG